MNTSSNISVKEDVQVRFYSAFSVPIKLIWNCVDRGITIASVSQSTLNIEMILK